MSYSELRDNRPGNMEYVISNIKYDLRLRLGVFASVLISFGISCPAWFQSMFIPAGVSHPAIVGSLPVASRRFSAPADSNRATAETPPSPFAAPPRRRARAASGQVETMPLDFPRRA